MRIVAGKFKGHPLQAPAGRSTRPTSDRAREAIFNILRHAEWAPDLDGAYIIDVFAGSGALGLEALSRGAAFCLFVETAPAAIACLRKNIDSLGVQTQVAIAKRSALSKQERSDKYPNAFGFAFLDPPYGKGLVEPALAALAEGQWLSKEAVIVVETGANEVFDSKDWELVDERLKGVARLSFLRRKSDSNCQDAT